MNTRSQIGTLLNLLRVERLMAANANDALAVRKIDFIGKSINALIQVNVDGTPTVKADASVKPYPMKKPDGSITKFTCDATGHSPEAQAAVDAVVVTYNGESMHIA